ncbi:MAG TPA: GtrA family protein [Candidatus Saccharimonadales bacterium]
MKWATTGIISTSFQILIVILVSLVTDSVTTSMLAGIVLSGQISFWLHFTFTWRDRHHNFRSGWHKLLVVLWRECKFVATGVGIALINSGLQLFFMSQIHDSRRWAWLFASVITIPLNLLMLDKVVFRRDDDPPTADHIS